MTDIEVRPPARDALLTLTRPTRRRLQHAIDELADQPRPHSAVEMASALRVRVDDHQVIYQANPNTVLILDVAHWSSPWHNT